MLQDSTTELVTTDLCVLMGLGMLMGWARKGLQPGDLGALSQLNKGWDHPRSDQEERLRARGFLSAYRVTLKGKLALLIRRSARAASS